MSLPVGGVFNQLRRVPCGRVLCRQTRACRGLQGPSPSTAASSGWDGGRGRCWPSARRGPCSGLSPSVAASSPLKCFWSRDAAAAAAKSRLPPPVPEAEEGKSHFLKKGVEATLTPSRPPTTHGGVSPCPPPPPTCKPRRAEAPLLLTSVSCSQRRGWHVVGPR